MRVFGRVAVYDLWPSKASNRSHPMQRRLIFAVATIAATIACGGSSTPTTPTPTIPTVTGAWLGGYTVTSCTESGAASGSGFCRTIGNGGTLGWTPLQSGGNLSGTVSIGSFTPIPANGTVGTDHVIALAGSGPIQFGASLALNTWRTTVSGSSQTGTMTYTVSTTDPIGAAVVVSTVTLAK